MRVAMPAVAMIVVVIVRVRVGVLHESIRMVARAN
jgi:hypothetical protein